MTDKRKPQKPFQSMVLSSAVLSYLVGPILAGIFGGRWLDEKLATDPLFMIIGLFVGLGGGIYGLVRLLGHYLGDEK
ncbi:F0F1-type ATP synthase assembly protein I [Salibacterium salarium]|uniref:AtpZ/AtpI family protein n=1 Tax=Salibacterium salarium TaxID=284579 RepID=A0A3R9Q1U5_9BACI|nr:AtpZ/AtpI family protein [Salibacterium salarium]MDQ0297824.1 F0F1-type ATP synthase assembly protein I [Salibacterium salarium]RSL31808.1 AtpZ/AtpI family protein [Salibacterium salarium]